MTNRRYNPLLISGLVLLVAMLACAQPLSEAPAEEPLLLEAAPTAIQLGTPTPEFLIPVTGGGEEAPQPAIPETRRLTLEYAPSVRAGDSTRIRLQLEADDLGNVTPTAVVGGNVVTGDTVQIPNLYETHIVVAEARLDMAGVEIRPSETISEPLKPGRAVTFFWSVRPPEAGVFEGTVWLHLRFIPMESLGGEQESRIPISAQFVTLEARSLFGLSGGLARGFGAAGSAVGTVIGFPFFKDIIRWFWVRKKRPEK